MKTKGRIPLQILLAMVLVIALFMSNIIIVSDNNNNKINNIEAESVGSFAGMDWETTVEEGCDIGILYNITSHWEDHYNVDVTLQNMTDERIDNWEICIPANFEIEKIWDAKVVEQVDQEYTIHNAEWNQDIPVDGSVYFGMTVKCSGGVVLPGYVYNNGLYELLDETEYKVKIRKYRQWDGGFIGQISITNLRKKKIEDWSLSFKCNFEMNQVWNAEIAEDIGEEDSNYYSIENPEYKQNIAPHQSVKFWFIAAGGKEPKLSQVELYEMTSDIDFSDDEEDEDEPDFDEDWFRKDSDHFETREEYEKYLEEHGYTDDALIDLE